MRLFRGLLVSGLVAAALCGCEGSDFAGGGETGSENAEETAASGLRIVSMDESAGALRVEWRNDGNLITYEFRLGPPLASPPSAEELALNPELASHEVDARVLDSEGRVFHVRRGGDALIEPSWDAPLDEGFDLDQRARDFGQLVEAIDAFRSLSVPSALEDLRITGISIGIGHSATQEKPDLGSEIDPGDLPGTLKPESNLASGPSSLTQWDFIVRKKNQIAGIIGHHSAILLRAWSSSSVVATFASCNHGTCADQTDKMSTHCVMPGFLADDGTNTRFFHKSGCSTAYDPDSTAVIGGAHNCNDDSEIQIKAIYSDQSQCTTCGSCNSLGLHNYAPGCARP
jgi:hypothetical protein